ncbi:flagella basal body P-ring formation protein FlgA [uncultured Erythrobacter sp.]|uniref:flagella basal body P-ring formation protein FlgA n=1 Tax=uncultured Erythrobacter sp. TaxID=263913 RepID=UPI002627BF29|nr:flagella basal body P-ring formation protein FlgA [uncultured Erythrobacter sp.]
MTPTIAAQRLEVRLMMTAIVVASLPVFATLASAQEGDARSYTNPTEIDHAVEQFTGAAIGEIGGARLPADRRLRLSNCQEPLGVKWHGRAQTIVRVDCTGPNRWHVFMAITPAKPAPEIVKVVTRGDPITVIVRGRGFSVQQSAEAMESGAVGDWIALRSASRRDTIRARIERPGLAVIPVD